MSSSDRPRTSVLRSARLSGDPISVPAPREPAIARREAEEVRVRAAVRESYERGLAEGEARVVKTLAERASQALEWVEDASRQIGAARAEFLRGAEDEVIRLTLALAEKILAREVRGSGDAAKGLLKQVLAGISDRTEITVRVSPETIDELRAMEKELGQVVSAPDGVRWVPDRRVARWNVLVETEAGKIDASVEAQLEEAAALFKEVASGRDA